jgi:glutaredoxin
MRQLDKMELRYEIIDVTLDRAAERDVKKMVIDGKPVMGYPVVVVSNRRRTERWAGFKLDKIRGLKNTGDY